MLLVHTLAPVLRAYQLFAPRSVLNVLLCVKVIAVKVPSPFGNTPRDLVIILRLQLVRGKQRHNVKENRVRGWIVYTLPILRDVRGSLER